MNLARKNEFLKSIKFIDVYLLKFDENQANLGFFYDFKNVVSFDDSTGHMGELQYCGSKKCFYTGSKNMANTFKKLAKGAGFNLQVKKTQICI